MYPNLKVQLGFKCIFRLWYVHVSCSFFLYHSSARLLCTGHLVIWTNSYILFNHELQEKFLYLTTFIFLICFCCYISSVRVLFFYILILPVFELWSNAEFWLIFTCTYQFVAVLLIFYYAADIFHFFMVCLLCTVHTCHFPPFPSPTLAPTLVCLKPAIIAPLFQRRVRYVLL